MGHIAALLKKTLGTIQEDGVRALGEKVLAYRRERARLAALPPLRDASGLFSRPGPVALILDHDAGGGALTHRRVATRALLQELAAVIVVQYATRAGVYEVSRHDGVGVGSARAESWQEVLALLERLAVRRAIVNELVGWPEPERAFALLGRVQASGASLEVQIHDFYALCPSYNLLNAEGVFCNLPESPAVCATCLAVRRAPFGDIIRWRSMWRELLVGADSLRAPDESVRELLARVYPELAGRVEISPGAAPAPFAPLSCATTAGPMVIGVPGTIVQHKGAAIVTRLAGIARERGLGERVVVVGTLPGRFRVSGLVVTGAYEREQLPQLMTRHGITVGVIPSVWPETYCYALRELMQLGLPVAAFDLGAQGRAVRGYARGCVSAKITAEALWAAAEGLHTAAQLSGTAQAPSGGR